MIDIEMIRNYILTKPYVEECFPFDEVTLVFKVGGKMFALIPLDAELLSINLKCLPDLALELREKHDGVKPGYHMNKTHWNTISINNEAYNFKTIQSWIDISYNLVYEALPKKIKAILVE
jgi:predicted DNA-binding protein (MmcQ/YjbR family)